MLSKKAQYAIKALEYLLAQPSETPILISEIAEKKDIPLKFLESILLELRKAGVLESKKGKGGGYMLKAGAMDTSIANILRTLDGPIALLPCVSLHFYQPCEHCDPEQCRTKAIFEEARDAVLSVLEKKTVRDLGE